jgi:hypothetical protein
MYLLADVWNISIYFLFVSIKNTIVTIGFACCNLNLDAENACHFCLVLKLTCPLNWSPSKCLKMQSVPQRKHNTSPLLRIERRGRLVNTPTSYSGSPEFISRLRDRLFSLRFFVAVLRPSRRMLRCTLKLLHDFFLRNRFNNLSFIYHHFIRRYIVWVNKKSSLNKLHTTNHYKDQLVNSV